MRTVEVCDAFWDQHGNLKKGHQARAAATDQPIGALLTDLRPRPGFPWVKLLVVAVLISSFGGTAAWAADDAGGN